MGFPLLNLNPYPNQRCCGEHSGAGCAVSSRTCAKSSNTPPPPPPARTDLLLNTLTRTAARGRWFRPVWISVQMLLAFSEEIAQQHAAFECHQRLPCRANIPGCGNCSAGAEDCGVDPVKDRRWVALSGWTLGTNPRMNACSRFCTARCRYRLTTVWFVRATAARASFWRWNRRWSRGRGRSPIKTRSDQRNIRRILLDTHHLVPVADPCFDRCSRSRKRLQ